MHTKYIIVDYVPERDICEERHHQSLRQAISMDCLKWYQGEHGGMRVVAVGYKDRANGHYVGKLVLSLMNTDSLDDIVDSEWYVHASRRLIDNKITIHHELKKYSLLRLDFSKHSNDEAGMIELEEDLGWNPDKFITLIDTPGMVSTAIHQAYQVTHCKDGVINVRIHGNKKIPLFLNQIAEDTTMVPMYDGSYLYFKRGRKKEPITAFEGSKFAPIGLKFEAGNTFREVVAKVLVEYLSESWKYRDVYLLSRHLKVWDKRVWRIEDGVETEVTSDVLDNGELWSTLCWDVCAVERDEPERPERVDVICDEKNEPTGEI